MNIHDAAAICYGDDALRNRRRELESEAEAERMAIKLFTTQANEATVRVTKARCRLQAINDELDQLEELLP